MKPNRMLMALALGALLPLSSVLADTYIKSVTDTDEFSMGGQTQPARVDTMEVWVTSDKAAMTVSEGKKVILDTDDGKFYFLDEAQQSYAEFPADMLGSLVDSVAPGDKAMADSLRQMMAQMMGTLTYSVEPLDSTQTIGEWDTKLYRITMGLPMGGSATTDAWVTDEVNLNWDVYRGVMLQMMAFMPGAESIYEEMKKIDGLTVSSTTTTNMMGMAMKSTQRLLEFEDDASAPEGTYEIPSDYKKMDSPMMMMGG